MAVRVLLVSDHPEFADALRSVLVETGIEIAGVASTCAAGLAILENDRPDVVVVDAVLPDDTGMATGRRILELWADLRLVLISTSDDRRDISLALDIGFGGYVMKDTSVADISTVVEQVARGEDVVRIVGRGLSFGRGIDAGPQLTSLERDVLALIADGATSRLVSTHLGLSANEVRSHIDAIFSKLGADQEAKSAKRSIGYNRPHFAPMDDDQLLSHLRSKHPRGAASLYPLDVHALRELHAKLHRDPPPSTA